MLREEQMWHWRGFTDLVLVYADKYADDKFNL